MGFKFLRLGFWTAVLFAVSSLYRTTRVTRNLSEQLLPPPTGALPAAAAASSSSSPSRVGPELVHLLAYPESGADRALEAIEALTNASTATSYQADLQSDAVPAAPPQEGSGPLLRAPHLDAPPPAGPGVLLLTKTHCGGHCDFCSANNESLPSLADFERECSRRVATVRRQPSSVNEHHDDRHHHKEEAQHGRQLRYYSDRQSAQPRRAVHMIRDPLEVLVARSMHRNAAPGPRSPTSSAANSSEGPGEGGGELPLTSGGAIPEAVPAQFRSWCRLIDQGFKPFRARDFGWPEEVDRLTSSVPCHSDLIRYVHWHNRAVELLAAEKYEAVRVLYYEDLTGDTWNARQTLQDLAHFLSLPVAQNYMPTVDRPPSHATLLFNETEARAAARLVRALASPECWLLLRHYVVPWLQEKADRREPPEASAALPPPPPPAASSHEAAVPPLPSRNASVAWLMSFPNSGTSYTITNVMRMSNATTATNYGDEAVPVDGRLVPVYSAHPDGPFLLDPQLNVPWLVLTKTHCTGYCDGCKFLDHVSSLQRFEAGCRETTLGVEPHLKTVVVSNNFHPAKLVHLFRSPYDNLYSRMHLGVKLRRAAGVFNDTFADSMLEDSARSLQSWCAYIDQLYEKQGDTQWFLTFTEAAQSRFSKVSCYSEIFRWIHWHNMAIEMAESKDIPVHYLYYEDYTSRFNQTITELTTFLKLPVVEDPLPFQSGKTYQHLFSNKEKRHIAELARFLATEKCWHHVRRYFEGFYNPNDNKDREADRYSSTIGNPEIVLLISFPNSGTSYTISNMQNVTRTSAATNTVHETKDLEPVRARSDMMDGPFLYEPHEGKPWKYILTKSHCSGFCDNCDLSASIKNLSTFETACRTTTLRKNDTLVNSQYDATAVKKIVHLFRDLYDNLVSRMHLGTKKRAGEGWSPERLLQFSDTKEGILSWCAHVDAAFGKNASLVPHTVSVQGTLTDVPCYSEIFRYVQWHNLAFQMIEQYGVPWHNIFYEDYETNYDHNVGNLLQFLELKRTHDNKPFIAGKHYKELFEPSHRRAIAVLVRQLATSECWSVLRRYFDEFDFREDHSLKVTLSQEES